MTNKSIGNFLSELRKEKGLTQKEIADFLNVSDKTVSHWECDKYSPDLSVIPILAEFFGVTCDEILKGERKAVEIRESIACETAEEPNPNINNFSFEPLVKESEFEKFAKIKLQNAYNKLKFKSVIAVFIAFFMQAILFVIIKLIGGYVAIWNFDLYAVNISAIFSVALGAIILFSSYLKFTSTLNLCNLQKSEHKKWKRKALSIYILIPMILFVLVCINSMIQMAPVEYDYGVTMEVPSTTGTTSESDEENLHTTTLPNVQIPTSNSNSGDSSVVYITGEDLLTSNP